MQFAGYVLAKELTVPSSGAAFDATTNAGSATVTPTAGTYTIITLCAMLQTVLNAQAPVTAGAWAVSVSTSGSSATGKVTISVSAGTFSITWTSTDLRDVLGFTATITTQTSITGSRQAKGIWFPDCACSSDVDLRVAPIDTKRRVSIAPDGHTSSARGTASYVHTNIRWGLVAAPRAWTAEEATVNTSYETFVRDCLLHEGHSWFPYDGLLQIFDHREVYAGQHRSVASWNVADLPELHTIRQVQQGYTGLVVITWPMITSSG